MAVTQLTKGIWEMTQRSEELKRQVLAALDEAFARYLDWQREEGDAVTFTDWVRDEAPALPGSSPRKDTSNLSRGARYAVYRLRKLHAYAWLRAASSSAVQLLQQGNHVEVVYGMFAGVKNAESIVAVLQVAAFLEAEDVSP